MPDVIASKLISIFSRTALSLIEFAAHAKYIYLHVSTTNGISQLTYLSATKDMYQESHTILYPSQYD